MLIEYQPKRLNIKVNFPTSFLDLSSSQLKLLSRRARKRLSTMKLPMTRAGRKIARQDSGFPWAGWGPSLHLVVLGLLYKQFPWWSIPIAGKKIVKALKR
jgi:hypothetical protein